MLAIIIGALLPIVVILLLGFFSGWHKDFTGDQATTLNRMVMLYALPLILFGSTVTIPRSQLRADVPLFLAVAGGMIGSFFIVLLAARFIFLRDLGTSALQALTIGGQLCRLLAFPSSDMYWVRQMNRSRSPAPAWQ